MFLDCAPAYFVYMCLRLPRIGARQSTRCAPNRAPERLTKKVEYAVVMENLFYNTKVVRRFDLKGKVRNLSASVAPWQHSLL